MRSNPPVFARFSWVLLAFAACSPANGHRPSDAASVPDEAVGEPPAPTDTTAFLFGAGSRVNLVPSLAGLCETPGTVGARPFTSHGWTAASAPVVDTQIESAVAKPLRCVVRTPGQWADLRHQGGFYPPADTVNVDFSREMLLVAARGDSPNSGYGITFERVFRRGDTIAAVVRNTNLPSGAAVIDMGVQPIVTARVPAVQVVLFIEI